MMKSTVLTYLFTFSTIIGFTQNNRIDSLKQKLAISGRDTTRVLILSELANEYKFAVPDSAFFYGSKALELARELGFLRGEARILFILGVGYNAYGNVSKALDLQFKSLQIADKNNFLGEKQDVLTQLGNYYNASRDYKKGLQYLHQALRISDPNRSESMAETLSLIGRTYFLMDKLDSAEYYIQLTFDLVEKDNIDRLKEDTRRWLGDIHQKRGDTKMALYYYHQSLIYDSTSANYAIAKVYQQTNNSDSAIYYARKYLAAVQKVKAYFRISNASKLLAELYKPTDALKVIEYNKLTIDAQDSLTNFAKTNAYESLSEFDEKERQYEIETAKTVIKNKTRQYALLSGIGIFLIIAFILYRSNKKQKDANRLLQQQKEEINSALSQLRSTQSQLVQSEKMASLGELTAGIAHEIQNPLNFVNNFSDLNAEMLRELKLELLSGNTEEAIAIAGDIEGNEVKINHHGKRAESIVKGMLQHSRASTGKTEPTDINALADEYLRLSYRGLRAKENSFNADIKTDFDKSIGKIEVTPQDIGRVLLNLYNNAFYSLNEKKKQLDGAYEPRVSVSTKKIGNQVELHIKDNGTGIPEKVLDKIYQPFFTTKPTGQGIGLGLSLSYDIVKAHGGELKVETKEGEFAEFVIQLPIKNSG